MITSVSRTGSGQPFPSSSLGTGDAAQFNTIVSNDLGTESFNAQNIWFYNFPTDGIRITFSGLYYITAGMSFAAQTQTGALRILHLYRQDITGMTGEYFAASSHVPVNNTDNYLLNVSATIRLFEEDIVRVVVLQYSATTTTFTSATSATTGCFDAFLTAALIIQ
jgi:hypothetical protein